MANKIIKILIEIFAFFVVLIVLLDWYIFKIMIPSEVTDILRESNRISDGVVSDSGIKQLINLASEAELANKFYFLMFLVLGLFIVSYYLHYQWKSFKRDRIPAGLIFLVLGFVLIFVLIESQAKLDELKFGTREQLAKIVIIESKNEKLYLQYKKYAKQNKLFRTEKSEDEYKAISRSFSKNIPKGYMIDFYEAQKL